MVPVSLVLCSFLAIPAPQRHPNFPLPPTLLLLLLRRRQPIIFFSNLETQQKKETDIFGDEDTLSQRVLGSHLHSSPWRFTTSYSFWSYTISVFIFCSSNFAAAAAASDLTIYCSVFWKDLHTTLLHYRWWQRSCTTLILMMIINTIYVFRGKTESCTPNKHKDNLN